MLTASQRERILSHLQRGWKLPDSLVYELWEAYLALERAHGGPAPRRPAELQPGTRGQPPDCHLPRERSERSA